MATRGDQPTAFSYAAAAIGGALTLLLAGYLAYDATRSKEPPRLSAIVVAAEVREDGGRSYVPVDVTNEGTARPFRWWSRPAAKVARQPSKA